MKKVGHQIDSPVALSATPALSFEMPFEMPFERLIASFISRPPHAPASAFSAIPRHTLCPDHKQILPAKGGLPIEIMISACRRLPGSGRGAREALSGARDGIDARDGINVREGRCERRDKRERWDKRERREMGGTGEMTDLIPAID